MEFFKFISQNTMYCYLNACIEENKIIWVVSNNFDDEEMEGKF